MKVTSTENRRALLKAREKYGTWSEVLKHAVRGEDGILRVPRIVDEHELATRKAG